MSDDLILRRDAVAAVSLGDTVTAIQRKIEAIPASDAVAAEKKRMMEWCAKRQKITRLNWERAARKALAGDMSELQNRIALIDAGPMDIVLSADAEKDNSDG